MTPQFLKARVESLEVRVRGGRVSVVLYDDSGSRASTSGRRQVMKVHHVFHTELTRQRSHQQAHLHTTTPTHQTLIYEHQGRRQS